jgi:hypothetical protein
VQALARDLHHGNEAKTGKEAERHATKRGMTICTGSMTGFGTIVVPEGASCVLAHSTVKGEVRVKRNASFTFGPPGTTAIHGDVRASHTSPRGLQSQGAWDKALEGRNYRPHLPLVSSQLMQPVRVKRIAARRRPARS